MGEDKYHGRTLEALARCTKVEEGDTFRHFHRSASTAALADTFSSIVTIPGAEHLSEKERADVYDLARFVFCRACYLERSADVRVESCSIKVHWSHTSTP